MPLKARPFGRIFGASTPKDPRPGPSLSQPNDRYQIRTESTFGQWGPWHPMYLFYLSGSLLMVKNLRGYADINNISFSRY